MSLARLCQTDSEAATNRSERARSALCHLRIHRPKDNNSHKQRSIKRRTPRQTDCQVALISSTTTTKTSKRCDNAEDETNGTSIKLDGPCIDQSQCPLGPGCQSEFLSPRCCSWTRRKGLQDAERTEPSVCAQPVPSTFNVGAQQPNSALSSPKVNVEHGKERESPESVKGERERDRQIERVSRESQGRSIKRVAGVRRA